MYVCIKYTYVYAWHITFACMKWTYVCAMYILWSVHICVCICVCKSLLGCWFTLNDVKMIVLQVNKHSFLITPSVYQFCTTLRPSHICFIHSTRIWILPSVLLGKRRTQKERNSARTSEAILRLLTLGTIINLCWYNNHYNKKNLTYWHLTQKILL